MFGTSKDTNYKNPVLEIHEIKRQDPVAVSNFLNTYESKILKITSRFARRGSYNHDLLVQIGREAAYNAVCHCQTFKGNIEPYICRAIINGIYEEGRRDKRFEELQRSLLLCKTKSGTDNDGFGEIDREDALPVIRRKISEWMDGLSEQKKKLVSLIFWGGMNRSQAAKKMNLSRARVSQLYNEIREIGRICLKDIAYLN